MFHDVLNRIIENKHLEIIELEKRGPFEVKTKTPTGLFQKSLEAAGLSVIAEIKRRSPSAGVIGEILKPSLLAEKYQKGEASAISVLTDAKAFGGSLEDLEEVATTVGERGIPILRKDFIIHPLQLSESAASSATAVLLIVAVLGRETRGMLEQARNLGLEALVEVHDGPELEIALDAGATVIGVNSRNLKTFEVSLANAEQVLKEIPKGIIKVAESGIKSLDDAKRMKDAGCDAVLIGESLVLSDDPTAFIQSIRGL
ncbi:MAG: indole-3-glycerol phosphate synthase [Chlamydiales bacterium]|jgi:indole-3-glycerol phosphate synthase